MGATTSCIRCPSDHPVPAPVPVVPYQRQHSLLGGGFTSIPEHSEKDFQGAEDTPQNQMGLNHGKLLPQAPPLPKVVVLNRGPSNESEMSEDVMTTLMGFKAIAEFDDVRQGRGH